jgi:hypothetical protein
VSSGGQNGGGSRRPAAAFPGLDATIRNPLASAGGQFNKQPSIDFSVEEEGGVGEANVVVASRGKSPPTRLQSSGGDDYYGGGGVGGQLPEYTDDLYDMQPDKVKKMKTLTEKNSLMFVLFSLLSSLILCCTSFKKKL